jgi:hypothetical protein
MSNTRPGATAVVLRAGPNFPLLSFVAACVMGVLFLLALHTGGKFIRNDWHPFAVWIAVPWIMSLMLWVRCGRPRHVSVVRHSPVLVCFIILIVLLFSSTALHKWFFFLQWAPDQPTIAKTGIARFSLLTALLTPIFVFRFRKSWLIPLAILIGSQVMCCSRLIQQTGGSALYRTDHPSFMFRLWEFTRNFPDLVTYMPHWNGGVEHYVSVTSGTSAPGLVLWPLYRFFAIHDVYTIGWAILFIFIVPWTVAGAVRALGGDRTAVCVGGILGLGVSQHYFLWGLHFGTIGAAFTSAMAVPVAVLPFRIMWLGRKEKRAMSALVLSGFLLLLWPPGGIVAAAVGLAVLVNIRRIDRAKFAVLAACGIIIAVLWSPWLRVILGPGMDVVDHVSKGSEISGPSLSWDNVVSGAQNLVAHIQEMNPLIIVFGFLGACVAGGRGMRFWFIPIFTVLALVTGWAEVYRPHSQLSRMSIPLAFAAVAPASIIIGRLLRVTDMRFAVVRAALVALLALSGYNISKICANRGPARYVTMDQETKDLVAWIRDNTPSDGRVLFAGKCVHGYGGGNVAYLTVLTGREMMAVDYYGFPPEQVLYEYPPREFRKPVDRTQEFYDAYAVSHLVTYHDNWKAHMRSLPDRFIERVTIGRTTIFERIDRTAKILRGNGSVLATFNRIDVSLDNPKDLVVLAYNWLDGLECGAPVEIEPFAYADGITLIGVRPNGQTDLTISYNP